MLSIITWGQDIVKEYVERIAGKNEEKKMESFYRASEKPKKLLQ